MNWSGNNDKPYGSCCPMINFFKIGVCITIIQTVSSAAYLHHVQKEHIGIERPWQAFAGCLSLSQLTLGICPPLKPILSQSTVKETENAIKTRVMYIHVIADQMPINHADMSVRKRSVRFSSNPVVGLL